MTIVELQKEKILCREKHPFRSKVLGGLLDGAKKIAKGEQRNATDADIILSAKKTIKALSNTMDQLFPADNLYVEYEKEIHILESFLPVEPSKEEIRAEITSVVNSLHSIEKNSMGIVMKAIKEKFPNADGKKVSGWVRESLSLANS